MALLGLIIPYSLQLIYFDMDSRNHTHALRRNLFTNLAFTFIHLPIHMSIVAVGAGLRAMIVSVDSYEVTNPTRSLSSLFFRSETTPTAVIPYTPDDRWLLCGSTGLALIL